MVILYKGQEIATLEDIQKLKVKDLKEILRSNSEATGGMKADLVLKVYAILMRNVVQPAENRLENVEDDGDFKYDDTIRRISALGWSSNQMLVFKKRGKPEYPKKNLTEQSREPTNSAHLLVEGKRSHHCANTVPPMYIGKCHVRLKLLIHLLLTPCCKLRCGNLCLIHCIIDHSSTFLLIIAVFVL